MQNKTEVTTEVLSLALNEAIELIENKPLPQAMLIDLAMFRLRLILKVANISEIDVKLADMALAKAKTIKLDATAPSPTIRYGKRDSQW